MDIQKKSGQSVTALPGSLHHKGFDKRALTDEQVLPTGTESHDLAESFSDHRCWHQAVIQE